MENHDTFLGINVEFKTGTFQILILSSQCSKVFNLSLNSCRS